VGERSEPGDQRAGASVSDLPDHHRDPFDRLLVAQAQVEGVPIMTADPAIAKYDVKVIPATA
jgi:PIN domain nuclease of toxin-antitoxin system